MAATPCPILLVTSSVTGNFSKVYEAMGHGGLDAVNTPVLGPDGKVQDAEGLLARLAKLARAKEAVASTGLFTALSTKAAAPPPAKPETGTSLPPVLALGASTGGPDALARILHVLPATLPAAVIVVQHIGVDFAPSLLTWLQGQTSLRLKAAAEGVELRPGEVLLAATNDHLVVRSDRRLGFTAEPVDYPYRPSVDALFYSLAAHWPRPGVAVLLTGMGADGAKGLLKLRQSGWFTIAQDQATCVVYGMPQAAALLDAACRIVPLPEIAAVIQAELPRR